MSDGITDEQGAPGIFAEPVITSFNDMEKLIGKQMGVVLIPIGEPCPPFLATLTNVYANGHMLEFDNDFIVPVNRVVQINLNPNIIEEKEKSGIIVPPGIVGIG